MVRNPVIFAKRKLRKLLDPERKAKVRNLEQSTDVGILYRSDSESKYILVKKLVERLKSEHGIPHVLALAYIPEKEPPFYHAHVLNHDYFTKKDLDWTGLPDCQAVEQFCNQNFDILLDLSQADELELLAILRRSSARFKVGRSADELGYDLILDMATDSTLDQYIKRADEFLTQLNTHEERQRV